MSPVLRRALAMAGLMLIPACYSLQPVTGQPLPAGALVTASLNDAGRVALGGQMGPAILEIEGRMTQQDNAEFVLAVAQIRLMDGGTQIWSGERVRVKREYINIMREKRFSKKRTTIISVATVAVLAALFSQSIKGFITGEDITPPVDTLRTIRYPLFAR